MDVGRLIRDAWRVLNQSRCLGERSLMNIPRTVYRHYSRRCGTYLYIDALMQTIFYNRKLLIPAILKKGYNRDKIAEGHIGKKKPWLNTFLQ